MTEADGRAVIAANSAFAGGEALVKAQHGINVDRAAEASTVRKVLEDCRDGRHQLRFGGVDAWSDVESQAFDRAEPEFTQLRQKLFCQVQLWQPPRERQLLNLRRAF